MDGRIIDDLKKSYGIAVGEVTPVTGGLLNLKWKVSSGTEDLLVKQYSMKRFNRDRMARIEAALQRQIILQKAGVPCPLIWQHNGRAIRWLDGDTAYMVMSFHSGRTEKPGTVTTAQMVSLGSACAFMHNAFSRLPVPRDMGLPASGGYTPRAIWDSYNARRRQCAPEDGADYRKALLSLEPILKEIDSGFFRRFKTGFAHEDFHVGNILFQPEGISAILDFDRNWLSYPWHDIGRAVLSFALEGNALNAEKARAFAEGYSRCLSLTPSDIADALRLTWCIETSWWILPEFFREGDEVPRRMKDEMLWLTAHWRELDGLLRG